MSNAWARRMAAVPIRPRPTTPKVQADKRRPKGFSAGRQLPMGSARSSSSWKEMLFTSVIISAMAWSATSRVP